MMEPRKLGSQGLVSSAFGLGITLLDTGDVYGIGHNELLIREAIRGRHEEAILSVKFGALRDQGTLLGFDGRPAFVKTSLAYTLQRFGVDYVDFYLPPT